MASLVDSADHGSTGGRGAWSVICLALLGRIDIKCTWSKSRMIRESLAGENICQSWRH
jgi:hypothetical protein